MKTKPIKTSTPGVYRRGQGYVFVLTVAGKQRWVSGFTTQKAAAAARAEAVSQANRGVFVAAERTTLAEYLETWVAGQRQQLKPLTWESYSQLVDRYIVPALGTVKLQQLSAAGLTAFYGELHRRGGHKGKPLSLRTVKYTHAVLRKALGDALDDGRVPFNAAANAKLPKIEHRADPMALPVSSKPQLNVWNGEQVNTFAAAVDSHRLGPVYMLMLNTGLRRGEALGLRAQDVDTERGVLHVRQSLVSVGGQLQLSTPKNGRSRSFKIGPRTLDLLRRQKATQAAEKLAWPGLWQNTLDLVFTAEDGSPIQVNYASRIFQQQLVSAGLPRIRLHDTRHTHATLALQAGTNIKVVSQRLGHSSVQLTWDVYSHVLPEQDDAAADVFEAHVYDRRTA